MRFALWYCLRLQTNGAIIMNAFKPKPFGGDWTEDKLDILEKYLNAYTTALKNKRFKLLYIDAFAGSGKVVLKGKGNASLTGSAIRAAKVSDPPFDEFTFIEKSARNYNELVKLQNSDHEQKIRAVKSDANLYLQEICADWQHNRKGWRGVLFLDPFAMQVEWATVKAVANTKALDVWLLFPVAAIIRLLPRKKKLSDFKETSVTKLNLMFGDDSWKQLYDYVPPQQDLFADLIDEREVGVQGIITVYKNKLNELVGDRLLSDSRTLTTPTNSPLFELIFFAGHPNGIAPAHRIAKHLIKHI